MSEKQHRLPLGVSAAMFFLAILLPAFLASRSNSETPLYSDGSAHLWIHINYRELVDKNDLTQSGKTVQESLTELTWKPYLKSQLQPFLEPYSTLLPQALDLLYGPPELPRFSVADLYPPGSPQPAWVAILRGGRIVVTDDGNRRASVFVPGDDPREAYKEHYGVLRHILAALLPRDQTLLEVSVYAYKNNYDLCRLSLNTAPFQVKTREFPPPEGKMPLDLVGLQKFFDQQPELSGAAIDQKSTLVLVGKKGRAQTVASRPVQLSDLAVAYRAVFHAGDNKPFVSLDAHTNPTLTKVNFGGFLEDSQIGNVILEADKRFKTITCGLDPNTFVDIRSITRKKIPDFATSSERKLTDRSSKQMGWVGTRFWYYPDSVELATDFDYRHAAIIRAQFEADAERSREDYGTEKEFERFKQTQLSASIRQNIDHLNQNYERYVLAFPELNEFSVVARLMGICVWLDKAKPSRLDLDSLLAVKLPGFSTPRERKKLLAASFVTIDTAAQMGLSEVQGHSSVKYLGAPLDQRLEEVFPTNDDLQRYLALASGAKEDQYQRFAQEAITARRVYRGLRVRNMITNEKQLKAFVHWATGNIDTPAPGELIGLEQRIDRSKSQITAIKTNLDRLSKVMLQSTEAHNRNVDKYNLLVGQHRRAVEEGNRLIGQYNTKSSRLETSCIMEIGGGVGLNPQDFTVLCWSSETKGSDLVRTKPSV